MTPLQPAGPIHIRPMRLEDIPQVQAIDQVSFTLPWPKSAYYYELNENPNSFLFVAEEQQPGGEASVVGLVVVWMILDEAHIATIAVHPDFRGQGTGGRLLVAALVEAIRRRASLATLEVRAGNLVAQQLYRRFHFETAGSRPRYYRDNYEDALIMTVSGLDESYLHWLESGQWENSESSGI